MFRIIYICWKCRTWKMPRRKCGKSSRSLSKKDINPKARLKFQKKKKTIPSPPHSHFERSIFFLSQNLDNFFFLSIFMQRQNVKGRKKCVLLWWFCYVLRSAHKWLCRQSYAMVTQLDFSIVCTRAENVHSIVYMARHSDFAKSIRFCASCDRDETYFSTIKAWPKSHCAVRCASQFLQVRQAISANDQMKWVPFCFAALRCAVQRVYFIHCAVWFASKGSACDL